MGETVDTRIESPIPDGGILPPNMREEGRKNPVPAGFTPWQKGQSGNPSGMPKRNFKIAELARTYTEEAVQKLVELMRNSESDDIQFRCAEALLNRGYGRAPLAIKLDDEGSGDAAARAKIADVLREAAIAAHTALGPTSQAVVEIIPPESKTPPNGAAFVAGMAVGAAISAALDEDS